MADTCFSATEDSHPPKDTAEVSHSPKATAETSVSMVKSCSSVGYNQTYTQHESIVKGAASVSSSVIKIYPWNNYKVSKKHPVLLSEPFRNRIADESHETGMKVTVEAVMLTEIDGSPALLLFQELPGKRWTLPGAVLKDGESEINGLKQALTRMLLSPDASELEVNVYEWEVGECLAQFWGTRHLNDIYVPYAVMGSQLLKKLFLVRMPAWQQFFIPILAGLKSFKFQKIHGIAGNPDQESEFDPLVAGVPLLVSKFYMASSTNTNQPDEELELSLAIEELELSLAIT